MPATVTDSKPVGIPIDQGTVTRLVASFEYLRSHSDQFGATFYKLLFERYPAVKGMFPVDMSAQQRKLVETLGTVVDHLQEPARVLRILVDLGKRDVGYGARPEQYPLGCWIMVEAIADLSARSGAPWGPTIAGEWATALELISEIMMSGAGQIPVTRVSSQTAVQPRDR